MFENIRMRKNCGKLIKLYREQINKDSTSQDYLCCNFILATPNHHFFEIAPGQPVCSKATLNRLERGQSTKDDDLYLFFIKKLGYQAHDDFKLTQNLEDIYQRLYIAADFYIVEDLEKIEQEVELLFENKKNWFYYREIYTAFKIIFDYYLRVTYPNITEADRMLETHFVVNTKLDEVLLTILFEFYYNVQMNIFNAEIIVHVLENYKDSMISKIALSFWCNYKEKYMDSFTYIEKALNYYTGKSDFRMGLFYYSKASILHSVNRTDIFDYFDLALECLEKIEGRLARDKTIKNYFNIGYHYYSLKSYDKAFSYFSKFLKYPRVFSTHFLYILNCSEMCGVNDLKELFKNVLPISRADNKFNTTFYNYFVMKVNKENDYLLEKCIMTKIYKVLKTEYRSKDLFEYFKNELTSLVKTTKRYKYLGDFDDVTSHKID